MAQNGKVIHMKKDIKKFRMLLSTHDDFQCLYCGNGKDNMDCNEISPQIYITCCRKCGHVEYLRIMSKMSTEEVQEQFDKRLESVLGKCDDCEDNNSVKT